MAHSLIQRQNEFRCKKQNKTKTDNPQPFKPTCKSNILIEDGNELTSSGSFSTIIGTVAPGKQWMMELQKLTFLMIKSQSL